ncbi:glycosyl hydrolase family 3 N terminal domain-containing protein [Lindgomyces ingoldianus]|uniref:Glycosyl hydrolase family 3 N terminal domain-containing protein n=1 Tax=Lindgomyces ingoldianus TaxID=673940 RepID=A0ACB6QI62_9PLEO|nr:glycosyl hydrolase family 3 N terminal domain-containing protein [Lindgomyces ingoldianus]KAF2466210.1 glycosyl hydrolase family 3 N terminal domain-containing protein [Lindgomyces ingoldianus]
MWGENNSSALNSRFDHKNNTVCNINASPPQRAAALVAAMTMDEKLVNLVDHSLGAERLGLPKYDWWSEALHGVAFSPGVHFSTNGEFSSATSFPNPITLSAAFDDALVEAAAGIIGSEARAFANAGKAGLDFWTPNINPFKDPRWGRGLETPGEDPLRIANYVKHLIKGLEGTEDTRQVIATCKHYAAYDLERWNGVVRYAFDAIVSMQDLVEYYLPPFRQCARDSNVGSIMCSYNSVNGTPACANSYLMQTVLREHWGWTKDNNYIVSDCNAVHNIYADHHWLKNAAQAAGAALTAGTDNVCEAGGWSTDVVGAYNQSLARKAVVDKALERQYEGLVRAGYFDPAQLDPYRSLGWSSVNTKKADSLARQSAVDGIVMLKNDGILPMRFGKNQSIAVIGMWANDTKTRMLGNYNGRPPFYRTPLYAAQQLGLKVNYADGPVKDTGNFTTALNAAKASDVIFYFGGIDVSIESEDLDRTTITWPESQLSLLRSLSALGKPIVVIQLGTQVDNTPLLNNNIISAILWTGYPGMYGGPAVFDIITGAKAPAGRLPITQYPGNYTTRVPMTDMDLKPSAKNPGRTYKWFDGAVQPFGFGLHYTNFTRNPPVFQSNLLLAECMLPHLDLCPFPPIPVIVTNTGSHTSDFVALAFISTTQGPAPHPIKELASYKRLRGIAPGQQREVELEMRWGDLARVDGNGNTVLYSGAYCLGLDVPERERLCFEVLGGDIVLDFWPKVGGGGNGMVRV